MMSTKGEFLQEKMHNMARWVTQEVGKENLSADIVAAMNGRTALEITMVCSVLEANKDLSTHRNWSGLVQLLSANSAPPELQEVVVAVQRQPKMHDKFWRYIDMFATVSAQ